MASHKDFKKEWFSKARIDYFSPFVNLWLSCNSWYNFHYAELKTDRHHVDKLKIDGSRQNALYIKFESIFTGSPSKEQKRLHSNIELLHFSLSRADIKTDKWIKPVKLTSTLIDQSKWNTNQGYEDLTIPNAKRKNGKLKSGVNGIDLGDIVVSNDAQKVFAGILEIIYQVRCMLVHGNLEPTDENHEVVKYCYLILYDLMADFCS